MLGIVPLRISSRNVRSHFGILGFKPLKLMNSGGFGGGVGPGAPSCFSLGSRCSMPLQCGHMALEPVIGVCSKLIVIAGHIHLRNIPAKTSVRG